MFKGKMINNNGVIVNREILFTTILKTAVIKVAFSIRNVKEFLLSKEWHPITNLNSEEFNNIKNRKTLSGKFQQIKAKKGLNVLDYNSQTLPANFSEIALNKYIDHLGNTSSMSPSQIVYAQILKQQIEWMKDAEVKPQERVF